MGTPALITVLETDREGNEHVLLTFMAQCDGYLDGYGLLLAEACDAPIVNGITQHGLGKEFNGMGCLAATLIAKFKQDVGHIYIERPRLHRDAQCWYYVYEVVGPDPGAVADRPTMRVFLSELREGEWKRPLKFEGTPSELAAWIATSPDSEE